MTRPIKKNRILYLCHRIPYPPNKGDKIRSFNEIAFLSEKYDIDLITFAENAAETAHKTELEKYCRRVKVFARNPVISKFKGIASLVSFKSISQGYFYHKGFQKVFDDWCRNTHYNAVFCFSSPMAEYVLKRPRLLKKNTRLIMDFCDLDSDKWDQYAQKKAFPLNMLYRLEGSRLLAFEKKINQVFDRSIFVSENERSLFTSRYPEARNCTVVPNGVDYHYFSEKNTALTRTIRTPMLMFSGAMDYYANVHGVVWFSETIYPAIKKAFPDITFYIVGSNPHHSVLRLKKDPSIIVTGFVPDIREFYKAADICVIPLQIARGVQNKVLEALSMGKAVVSTSRAIQGIHAEPGRDLITADTPEQFSRAVTTLLKNKSMARDFRVSGRAFVKKHYNWHTNLTHLL